MASGHCKEYNRHSPCCQRVENVVAARLGLSAGGGSAFGGEPDMDRPRQHLTKPSFHHSLLVAECGECEGMLRRRITLIQAAIAIRTPECG